MYHSANMGTANTSAKLYQSLPLKTLKIFTFHPTCGGHNPTATSTHRPANFNTLRIINVTEAGAFFLYLCLQR